MVGLYEGIMTTRAMRRFTDEPVTRAELEDCLRAAAQAPSGGNIQPWQFLVVTDPDKRAAVGKLYEECYLRYEATLVANLPPFRSPADEAAFERTRRASLHLAQHLGSAPAMVLFLMPSISMTMRDELGDMDIGTPFASVYPAVQNFCLAARSMGLGTALTTVYRIRQEELRTLLDIPEKYEIVALVPVGRPTGSFGVARRRPAESVTHWNGFGAKEAFSPAASPLAAAASVAGVGASAAAASEAGRRLAAPVVDAAREAGLFRMCVPRDLGGLEVHPSTLVEAIATVAAGDGAAGWCVMIGATTGLVSAHLDPSAAAEVYGDPGTITGGVVAPRGSATVVDGGYRVSGRWPFGSGCQHSDWLLGGVMVPGEGPRLMLFPAADVTIHDTWHTSGLRGTGSHDFSVDDVFVPASLTLSLLLDAPVHRGQLYRIPLFGVLALGVGAVALGIARASIDTLVALAGGKVPTGQSRALANRSVVQLGVADARARVDAAAALMHASIDAVWSARTVDVAGRAALRNAAAHAAAVGAEVATAMYRAGGGTAIYEDSLLQRQMRDAQVVTQHMIVASPAQELVGRTLLGVEADVTLL